MSAVWQVLRWDLRARWRPLLALAILLGVLGGQRQRLAIARALANEPTLVLADEPTGALDSDGGQEVIELLRRLHAGGQTILLVTHDKAVADAAERVAGMLDGRITAEGAVSQQAVGPTVPVQARLATRRRPTRTVEDPLAA